MTISYNSVHLSDKYFSRGVLTVGISKCQIGAITFVTSELIKPHVKV